MLKKSLSGEENLPYNKANGGLEKSESNTRYKTAENKNTENKNASGGYQNTENVTAEKENASDKNAADENALGGYESENERCDNCILWDEIDSLKEEILRKTEELRLITCELDEYKGTEAKSKKRLRQSAEEADRLNKKAQYEYLTELKTIRLISDKIRSVFSNELSQEKSAITGLLTDLLKEVDTDGYLYKAKDTALSIEDKLTPKLSLSSEQSDDYEDSDFDLDEAINPKESLDLKSLLNELGVFGSNEKED